MHRLRHPGLQCSCVSQEAIDGAVGVNHSWAFPSHEFQVGEHLCLQVYHTNIIHKNTALLVLLSSDLSSLKMSHPNAVPSQNYGTWIFTNVINFSSVSCPIGVLHHSTDKWCNWRIEALGCEKWRNHSLRYYICSFFVGGFVLIVN